MPFVEELWNNTTSLYKNWHNKIKWFSIFIKPNKCQKNRKETKTESLPGAYLQPSGASAGPVVRPLAQPPTVVLLATTEGQGHAPARAATRPAGATFPATSCFSSSSSGCPARCHAPPLPLSLSLALPPPLVLFCATTQAPPSPPHAIAAATASPSPSLRVQKLRHVVLHLSVKPRASGGPGEPPRRRLHLRSPEIVFAAPSSSTRPRARRLPRPNRRELLRHSPLSV